MVLNVSFICIYHTTAVTTKHVRVLDKSETLRSTNEL